jgi:hypothetical protein
MAIIDQISQGIGFTSFADLIRNSFTGISFSNTIRIPMMFTSTKRLRSVYKSFDFASGDVAQLITQQINQNYLSGELPIIEMAVNPQTINWKQPKRITKRDTQQGSIFFHFTNKNGQNNDILTLDFSGTTGNIDYRGDSNFDPNNSSTISNGAIRKAIIWHNLWNLTREPMILEDGSQNNFYILYSSNLILSTVMLVGFFNSVLSFGETAGRPFSKDYNFSFVVTDTTPPLDDLLADIQTAVTSVTGQTIA